MQQEPIDAVITWVDGSDPKHAKKLEDYLQSIGGARPKSASKTRFHNAGELDYCVSSIIKFAPWIRTIFIVTDDQQPPLMQTIKGTEFEARIKIIDHTTIFQGYESALPSFNSMAISSLLWKIPDLAEKFLFLNDDFVFISPTTPEDFFRGDKVVLRGKWQSQPTAQWWNPIVRWLKKDKKNSRISFWGLQQNCAHLVGFDQQYFRLPHVPHAWTKTAWQTLATEYQTAVEKNIHAHLRKLDLFVPESLSAHFHLKSDAALIDNSRTNVQLKPTEQSLWRIKLKLYLADRSEKYIVSCVQSIESASPEKQKLIFDWLDKRVGGITAHRVPPLKRG
jgi:Stealth protein CR2, conserved region 2/Stealth protein CR1, conserved region 1